MELTPAPYFRDIAEGPEGGVAHWVTCEDGLRIRVGHWLPDRLPREAVKGTVLIFPGRTEYIEKYGPSAVDLGKRGFAALAVDWRGQGLADRMLDDRLLGHVDHFPDFQRDVRATVKLAEALDLPQPWFLLAHSMGGAIGLRALIEGLPVKACAFTGPMWGIQIPAAMRPVARILGTLAPILGFSAMRAPTTTKGHYVQTAPYEGNTLTNDADMYRFMQEQLEAEPDLTLGGPTVHWLSESLQECARLAALPSPALPCVTFLGSDEQIVNAEAIHERMRRWPGGELDLVQGAQHEVVMEGPAIRRHSFDRMCALFEQYRG